MRRGTIEDLMSQMRSGTISRRQFGQGLAALGVSAGAVTALAGIAGAQDASPEASPEASPAASPAASPVAYTGPVGTLSISREDYNASIKEAFGFEEAATTGGVYIYAETSDMVTLNGILSADVYSNLIISLFNDALVATSPVDGTWVPGIADSWEIGADGLTYTFHLNPTVKWHDGTPFTADDVVFSFDGVLSPDSLSPRTGEVSSVLASYKAIDANTVELVANAPVATFIDKTVGQVAILPKHIWESVPIANWGSDSAATGADPSRVIGTGPFTFKEWVQGDHVTLVKNPEYWDSANVPVYIDEFNFRVIVDAGAALQSLITGESDVLALEAPQAVGLLDSNPEINQTVYDTFNFGFYAANQDAAKTDLFQDLEVRQALMYGLDRDLIVETIYLGYATRADGTQPVPSAAYDPSQVNTIYNYDPETAKSLLAAAGWADSDGDGIVEKDGKKLSFECEYPEGLATYQQQIPYMQQAWKEIGIEMIPAVIPFGTLVDHVLSSNYVMSVLGFSWGVDPDQGAMFGSQSLPPGGFNLIHWTNEEYDALGIQQNQELDVEKRIALLIEQANIVNDDAAMGIMTFSQAIAASNPRVHNYFPNAYSGSWSTPYIWLDEI